MKKKQTQDSDKLFALGFGTQSSKIIREYANGSADGFLNDLAAGHVKPEPTTENALVESFIAYMAER